MRLADELDASARESLSSIYAEVMWLAARPNTSPSAARAWYTHVAAGRLSRHIRQFSGKVSEIAAADQGAVLRLEHFKRIQTTLTQLVRRHLDAGHNCDEFVQLVLDHEQVHIVTVAENYAAMRAKGDYATAGIALVDWHAIAPERRRVLWNTMLKGRVANARQFEAVEENCGLL